jgi:hypothetical protein
MSKQTTTAHDIKAETAVSGTQGSRKPVPTARSRLTQGHWAGSMLPEFPAAPHATRRLNFSDLYEDKTPKFKR